MSANNGVGKTVVYILNSVWEHIVLIGTVS